MAAAAKGVFTVDSKALMKIVDEALEQERDYKLRNDAKFRAVEQKTANYQEFKGIVDLAHLQPLKKDDYTKPARDADKNGAPWTPLDKS